MLGQTCGQSGINLGPSKFAPADHTYRLTKYGDDPMQTKGHMQASSLLACGRKQTLLGLDVDKQHTNTYRQHHT